MLRYSVSSNLNKIRGRFSSTLPYYTNPYKGNGCLGLVREDFSMWERRSPLCPHHVQELVRQGLKVIVQPSTKRIYTDKEYMDAGAIIKEDLSDASLVIGVKQIPASKIADNKSYLFFSHTIKAQANNMQLLDTILEKKARLFDYECITEGGLDGKPRLVAFGKYAGVAGMIDCFQGLGQKLLAEGYSNPFLNIPQSYMYQNLDEARYTLRSIGAHIERYGLPEEISPMVFTFTGGGNVTKGAREMFELLPFEYVDVRELPSLAADVKSGKRKNNRLYAVLTSAKDMVKHKDGSPLVNNRDYYDNPKDYVPVFHENVIPYTSVLVNGMYWDARYPRLLTNSQIQDIRKGGNKNLKMVADITCDPQGSVEFLSHCTTIEKPFFSYIPEADENSDNLEADGIAMLGVEILPSEVPRDASEHFGEALMPLLPPLLRSAGSVTCDDMSDLPKEMQRACIASHGKLLPKWEYIQTLREQNHVLQTRSGSSSGTIVLTVSELCVDDFLLTMYYINSLCYRDICLIPVLSIRFSIFCWSTRRLHMPFLI